MARFLLTALFALISCLSAARAEPVTILDLAGREVTLEAPARRILLGQSAHLPALGLLHPDPASLIIGLKPDLRRDPETWRRWTEAFPRLKDLPILGAPDDASFSVETAIALQPDLVILSFYTAGLSSWTGRSRVISQLESAGIPVAVIDFFADPLENAETSLRILGRLIGEEARAEEVAAFYAGRRARLAAGIAGLERPRVMIHAHAGGTPCCLIVGKGVFAEMAAAAGGEAEGGFLTGAIWRLSAEGLFSVNPDVYLATGGAHVAESGGASLGLGVTPEAAQASFCAFLRRESGIGGLPAAQEGHAFAIWHLFNDSPIHIALLEFMAQKFHPEAFADLDPEATLAEMSRRFSALPLEGAFWTGCPEI